MCPCGEEGQQHPGLHWEECFKQVEGGDPYPLLSTREMLLECWVQVQSSPVQERHGHNERSSKESHEND